MNPDGQLHGVFPAPHQSDSMAAEIAAVIN